MSASKTGGDKYSIEESTRMIKFAKDNPEMSQPQMWAKAVEENLCPGRTMKSMKTHFKILNERLNRTQPLVNRAQKFTPEEDRMMLMWMSNWVAQNGRSGLWSKAMWDAAEQHKILDRTSTQMKTRFHNKFKNDLDAQLEELKGEDFSHLFDLAPRMKGNERLLDLAASMKSKTPVKKKAESTAGHTVTSDISRAHEMQIADELLSRVRAQTQSKSVEEVLRALYFTCCDEKATVALLNGEELDSKFDVWTPSEDKLLMDNQVVNRPDVKRRRVFLGLDKPQGF